jgi:hypothetical protein
MLSDSIEKIAKDLYSYLADRFPVCCSSDEFIFFPQALPGQEDWSRWDDFSADSVLDAVQELRSCRDRLYRIQVSGEAPDPEARMNISLLYRTAEILEEQLSHVRHHAVQPTFILMVAAVGLGQALQDRDSSSFKARIGTLPGFLDLFRSKMGPMPDLFRRAGIQMAGDFSSWMGTLGSLCDPKAVLIAMEDFARDLESLPSYGGFRLDRDMLERVVHYHTGSGMDIRDCILELEDEIGKMSAVLESEARRMGYGKDWEAAFGNIGRQRFAEGEKSILLRKEISRLKRHCILEGFPGLEEPDLESIAIEPLPESLVPVRSTDSYTARPGHPYRGGVFYIFGDGGLGQATGTLHPVYRMTAAHETYPGHHLLDTCRWNNPNPLRRPIEYPLYYEGWACFGEELMQNSGAFDRAYDMLILARRRYRHALRGKVDLLLHRGDLDLDSAALELTGAGFSKERARETVRKYALRPAYQMCYTIGYRRFKSLFESFGGMGIGSFATAVLEQGEIRFEDLENVLEEKRCLESGVS